MINTITPVITTETRERRVNKNIVTRGDIILVDLPNVGESVQTGRRPAIVVQNNMGNAHSPLHNSCTDYKCYKKICANPC